MLNLASASDPHWGERAIAAVDEVLLDHAHCEKKAASTALSLIFRYADQPELALPLSELAREELRHFELVVGHLRDRGEEHRRQKPSPYAAELMSAVRTHEPARLIDTLLCCALIEARSCERMTLIAEAFEHAGVEPRLQKLYRGLLASEARHHATYVDLIRRMDLATEDELRTRLAELAEHEARVIAGAPSIPRMHASC